MNNLEDTNNALYDAISEVFNNMNCAHFNYYRQGEGIMSYITPSIMYKLGTLVSSEDGLACGMLAALGDMGGDELANLDFDEWFDDF